MVFKYKKWDEFCKELSDAGMTGIPACAVKQTSDKYIVLKHDVETDVPRAYKIAEIEHKYGHKGSYYVQAYLLHDKRNIELLQGIQAMGHEVSYHYDVMDSNKGDIEKAIIEFDENKKVFEENGFHLITVCQHGNPVVERIGYTSNRDFFRNDKVQELYREIADIMVDYKTKFKTDYTYYSDAGRQFSSIFDPINNDRIKSDDKNIKYPDLKALYKAIADGNNAIISTHTHRWCGSSAEYMLKNGAFRVVKGIAKALLHIPGMRKVMGRYYYLAKKF